MFSRSPEHLGQACALLPVTKQQTHAQFCAWLTSEGFCRNVLNEQKKELLVPSFFINNGGFDIDEPP